MDGSLLFARKTTPSQGENSFNQLWLISDVTQDTEPVSLIPSDVLYADWIPGQENTISYSTGEATDAAPGWQAYNDLWQMRIDPVTGGSVNVDAYRRTFARRFIWLVGNTFSMVT